MTQGLTWPKVLVFAAVLGGALWWSHQALRQDLATRQRHINGRFDAVNVRLRRIDTLVTRANAGLETHHGVLLHLLDRDSPVHLRLVDNRAVDDTSTSR